MQGRVLSLIVSGATAMSPINLLIEGPVADYMGFQIWHIIGGAISIIAVIIAYFIPAIMGFEDNHPNIILNESPIPIEQ